MLVKSAFLATALLSAGLALSGVAEQAAPAAAAAPENLGPDRAAFDVTVRQAVDFLRGAQSEDGSFSASAGPGVTAIAVTALLRHDRPLTDPTVARGIAYLEGFVQPDGGIYRAGTYYRNYETCLAVLCLKEANRDGRYTDVLKRAEAFIKGIQWDEGEGHDASSTSYGGTGYGKHKRPDLSNTSFFVETLQALGNGPDDPAIQRALVFVSRCQNKETEHNTTKWSAIHQDGGMYYTPAAGGSSQAGMTPEGGLRSYGSMTYAGLKSMIYAGVGPDDPRVEAAYDWARKHYTLEENPGMGKAGLYYYYHTFAKTLDAMDLDRVEDTEGRKHDWRRELAERLAKDQRPDGSWTNSNPRWLEGDPNLVTAYALLSLSYCKPKAVDTSSEASN